MKIGIVEEVGGGLYAYAEVLLRGPSGREARLYALVDTGYNAYVSVPSEIVNHLGLSPLGTDDVILANAGTETAGIFVGEVSWGRQSINVPVHQIGDEPTIGTALLRDHKLSIDFAPDGDVQIYPII